MVITVDQETGAVMADFGTMTKITYPDGQVVYARKAKSEDASQSEPEGTTEL